LPFAVSTRIVERHFRASLQRGLADVGQFANGPIGGVLLELPTACCPDPERKEEAAPPRPAPGAGWLRRLASLMLSEPSALEHWLARCPQRRLEPPFAVQQGAASVDLGYSIASSSR
jgi:hypothetical protein